MGSKLKLDALAPMSTPSVPTRKTQQSHYIDKVPTEIWYEIFKKVTCKLVELDLLAGAGPGPAQGL